MMQNVFAVLAHNEPDSVHDLIENLQHFDPLSQIILYDGGVNKSILALRDRWRKLSVDVVPNVSPQTWGCLHRFAIDCIDYVGNLSYDTLTFVDSDQLLVQAGYSEFLAKNAPSRFGVLSVFPHRHGVDSNILCVRELYEDRKVWMPYLAGFPHWEEAFVRWTFWPGTVLSADAARAISAEMKSELFATTLRQSRAWATEECVIPTISALLGFPEVLTPFNRDWCRYRTPWTTADIDKAASTKGAFFVHPVQRSMSDPVRRHIRDLSRSLRSEAGGTYFVGTRPLSEDERGTQ
jgi:hypothetical protein